MATVAHWLQHLRELAGTMHVLLVKTLVGVRVDRRGSEYSYQSIGDE